MHSFADAWVVMLQAHEAELDSSTSQLAEKQSLVEGKLAEIGELGHGLAANQQEVEAVQQTMASAAQENRAAAQVGDTSATCLAVVMQLHKSIQQLISWLICLTVPSHHAITVLAIQQGA